jgi:hypothetical protein
MSERPRENPSRRELVAGALRYAALGLVATGGAALFAKRRRLLQQGICINDRLCDGCAIFPQCELPQALSARKIQSGVISGGR